MGNKHKKKQNSKPVSNHHATVVATKEMNIDDLKQALVAAILEAEEIKILREQEQKEREKQERRQVVGYKDYSQSNSRFKGVLQFLNDVKVVVRLLFMPKKDIKGDAATYTLLKVFLSALFFIVRWVLLICSLLMVAFIPAQYFMTEFTPLSWTQNISLGIYSILIFAISQLFRAASVEIEKIENNNFFFSVFASMVSIISLIIAIISFMRGG